MPTIEWPHAFDVANGYVLDVVTDPAAIANCPDPTVPYYVQIYAHIEGERQPVAAFPPCDCGSGPDHDIELARFFARCFPYGTVSTEDAEELADGIAFVRFCAGMGMLPMLAEDGGIPMPDTPESAALREQERREYLDANPIASNEDESMSAAVLAAEAIAASLLFGD